MTEVRTATAEDIDRIFELNMQAYNTPRAMLERRRALFRPDEWLVGDEGGRVVATLRGFELPHRFGGGLVNGVAVASVAVAPEARGGGIARALMQELLRRERGAGRAISTLYPATVPLYRRCGYGFSSIYTEWTAPLRAFPRADAARATRALPAVEPFDDAALADVAAAYESFAAARNGMPSRDERWWKLRVLDGGDASVHRYLVREGGEVTGWIVYTQASGKDDWRFDLNARDFFWTTEGAARALLSFVSHQRSTGKKLHWTGPPTEPLADLFDEDTPELESAFRSMLRLLDVPAAIEARGYPAHVEAEVSIAVDDPQFAENAGPWRVEVSGGTAKVSATDAADARASVQTLASVWSSLLRPADAVRTGGLEATPRALDALERIFAGPLPWTGDFY
jgi:predicted acetyltransferase